MEQIERPSVSHAWLLATGVVVVLVLVLLALGYDAPYLLVAFVLIVATAVAVTTWALLRTRHARRSYERRLAQLTAERAVQAERLRIARDLHDLASHGLGMMTIRAATANLLGDDSDGERREALRDVEKLSRQTTAELREMLTLLRGGTSGAEPLRPAPSLDDLPDIVDQFKHAGATVSWQRGDLGDLAPGVQLAVCAVIQEALTNVMQHAGPTCVRLATSRSSTRLLIEVEDDGPVDGWNPRRGTGNGLLGLRERLAVHHGTLEATRTSTGFRLVAQIPGDVS